MNNYPDPRALDLFNKLIKIKDGKARQIWIGCTITMLSSLYLFYGSLHMVILAWFIIGMLGFIVSSSIKAINKDEYYTIPTAKDINDQHRCIFCGHHQITSGDIGRGDLVANNCSNCNKFLYLNKK